MANSNSTPKSRKSAAVPYVDDNRDFRDIIVLSAIKSAILLIANENQCEDACNVLRLARDRLEACWPYTDEKFTAAVSG